MENSVGEGGLAILEFGGQGGDEHFGISEGKGMDIFWNHPIAFFLLSYLDDYKVKEQQVAI